MKEFIFLYGEIFKDDFEEAKDWGLVGSNYVSQKLKEFSENPEITDVEVHINSPGGNLFEGMAIYDLLKASKFNIVTVAVGQVASAATLPFLVPDDPKDRLHMENATFMIHKPSMALFGNSDDHEDATERLRELEDRVINIYSKKTGQSDDQIREWMEDEGTWFDGKEIMDAGFSGAEMEEIFALGHFLFANKSRRDHIMTKTKKTLSIADRIKAASVALMVSQIAALDLATDDGQTMSFQTEKDVPEVGNVVTVGGASPEDGDYTMANGLQVTVEGGKVTNVASPAQEGTSEQVTQLLEGLTTAVTNLTKRMDTIEDNQNTFTEEWEKVTNHLGNRFQLNTRKSRKPDTGDDDPAPISKKERDQLMLERRQKKLGISATS